MRELTAVKLVKSIADLQSGRTRGVIATLVRLVLLPAGIIYWLLILIRRLSYKLGIIHSKRLEGTVISIGNITTGGTGKTPLTLMLAKHFLKQGQDIAILSRGYKSPHERSGLIFNSAEAEIVFMNELGDEVAFLVKHLSNCWFGIGRDRYRNGKQLRSEHGVKLFLLDDGFQHWRLQRDLDIVLIDATNLFGTGLMFPAGNLRENRHALKRADLVVITRTDLVDPENLDSIKKMVSRYVLTESIFETHTVLESISDLATGERIDRSWFTGKKTILFAGIGNQDAFIELIRQNGIEVAKYVAYRDHYKYTERDIRYLTDLITMGRCDCLITTEKDAVKLPVKRFKPQTCLVAEISFAFDSREDIFFNKIGEVIVH